jgi:hypothetical protein
MLRQDPCVDKKKRLAVVATCKLGAGKATAVQTGGGGHPHPAPPPGPPPPGTWLITMNELYTGWFEVHNMTGAPNSTVHFEVSTTPGSACGLLHARPPSLPDLSSLWHISTYFHLDRFL